MTPERSYPLQPLIVRVASTRPGAWFFSRVLRHVDRLVLWLSRRRTTLTGALSGLPVVILTTRGARSGKPRTHPLLLIRDDESPRTFALIPSNFGQRHHPAWYHNLKAHPRAECASGGKVSVCMAHEAHGEEYAKFWQLASRVYPGYARYEEWAGRHIPIMVLTPEPED